MRRYKECIKYVFYFLEQTFYGPLFTLYSPFVEKDSSKNEIRNGNCIPQNDKNKTYMNHIVWYIIIFMKYIYDGYHHTATNLSSLSVVILPCLQKYGNEFAGY